ncbi:MAG: hypothetical protein ACR2LC_04810 [Pyrinomonadaceae bacterium]
MSSSPEDKILGLPRRPRTGDTSGGAILGALVGGFLTGGLGGALLGGVAGNTLANQRQPLETAVRQYFAQKGMEVIFFHRAPRAVKVTFRYGTNAYWTIESVMPDELKLPHEDVEDWLYGNLVKKELPKAARRIKAFTAR